MIKSLVTRERPRMTKDTLYNLLSAIPLTTKIRGTEVFFLEQPRCSQPAEWVIVQLTQRPLFWSLPLAPHTAEGTLRWQPANVTTSLQLFRGTCNGTQQPTALSRTTNKRGPALPSQSPAQARRRRTAAPRGPGAGYGERPRQRGRACSESPRRLHGTRGPNRVTTTPPTPSLTHRFPQ